MAKRTKKKRTSGRRSGRKGARPKRVTRRAAVAKVPFMKTSKGRIRFKEPASDKWSRTYASRQGARRAAKRAYKGRRVATFTVPA
jgi:hypothetical protein